MIKSFSEGFSCLNDTLKLFELRHSSVNPESYSEVVVIVWFIQRETGHSQPQVAKNGDHKRPSEVIKHIQWVLEKYFLLRS